MMYVTIVFLVICFPETGEIVLYEDRIDDYHWARFAGG